MALPVAAAHRAPLRGVPVNASVCSELQEPLLRLLHGVLRYLLVFSNIHVSSLGVYLWNYY